MINEHEILNEYGFEDEPVNIIEDKEHGVTIRIYDLQPDATSRIVSIPDRDLYHHLEIKPNLYPCVVDLRISDKNDKLIYKTNSMKTHLPTEAAWIRIRNRLGFVNSYRLIFT